MNWEKDDLIDLIGKIPEDYVKQDSRFLCQLTKKTMGICNDFEPLTNLELKKDVDIGRKIND